MTRLKAWWKRLAERRPTLAQFIVFFILSNGVTVLQLALMPILKAAFSHTGLIDQSFQIGQIGTNLNGSPYYIFDYAAGALPAGGGGLAYFLAVETTLLIAQVINFFAQRNITFKSNSSITKAALWYAIAYVAITLIAAALQGLYKAPIYHLLIDSWGRGAAGGTIADVVTMIINSTISFWVFFPIFKVIFRSQPTGGPVAASPDDGPGADSPGDPVGGSGPVDEPAPKDTVHETAPAGAG
ncbi:MAG: hypothetical protein LBL55_05610, partial [Propionibacteriaceae bacterium]|nr:hypothetical protein [Propionibacteriaceae bacterium]